MRFVSYTVHLALYCALPLAFAQLAHSSCLCFFSTDLPHVIFDHPTCTFLFPSGYYSITTIQSFFFSFLSICPVQFHICILRFRSYDWFYLCLLFQIWSQFWSVVVNIILGPFSGTWIGISQASSVLLPIFSRLWIHLIVLTTPAS